MARPRLGDSDSKRLQMVITEDELLAIDDWQHANKIASRSEAIRRLVQIGLFVDNEIPQIVDQAANGLEILADQTGDVALLSRITGGPQNSDLQYGQEEVRDIIHLAAEHAEVAFEGVRAIHVTLVSIYNVIAAIVDTRTVPDGLKEAKNRIAQANAAMDKIDAEKWYLRENRYFAIWMENRPPEDEAHYNSLSDAAQDEYLAEMTKALAAEEDADPVEFARRYKIKPPFWETPGWATRLRKRSSKKTQAGDVK